MPRARIFFVCGEAAETMWGQAMDRPRMDRGQRAKSLRAEQHRRSDTREACVRREEGYFGERLEECLLVLQVGVEVGA